MVALNNYNNNSYLKLIIVGAYLGSKENTWIDADEFEIRRMRIILQGF